jgi:hypothetical protein
MNRYITEQEVRAIFKDEMRRMIGIVAEPQDIEWLPTSEACRKLNYPSQDSLRKAVSNGTLRLGFEVQDRRSPESRNCSYYFNIPACVKRLNTPPEKRA